MQSYAIYFVEPFDGQTNEAIKNLLEQQAVVSECRNKKCSDGSEHSVWEISGADTYALLKKSAATAGLSFRTWVEMIKDERPMLLETVEGEAVIAAAEGGERADTPEVRDIRRKTAAVLKNRVRRGLHLYGPKLDAFIKKSYSRRS